MARQPGGQRAERVLVPRHRGMPRQDDRVVPPHHATGAHLFREAQERIAGAVGIGRPAVASCVGFEDAGIARYRHVEQGRNAKVAQRAEVRQQRGGVARPEDDGGDVLRAQRDTGHPVSRVRTGHEAVAFVQSLHEPRRVVGRYVGAPACGDDAGLRAHGPTGVRSNLPAVKDRGTPACRACPEGAGRGRRWPWAGRRGPCAVP